MPIPAYFHPGFEAPLGNHIMPIQKFALVANRLRGRSEFELREPEPATEEDLLRVHTPEYVNAIRTGQPRALAESQKFPWSPKLYSSVLLTNGAVCAAADAALDGGIAAAIASGFHHSCADHGEGFCTFNGLVIALEKLRTQGRLRHGAVLDLDLHYGNGTASLAASRPWMTVLSIYGNDYMANTPYRDVSILRHEDGENHFSVPLHDGLRGEELFDILKKNLPRILSRGTPDIILYQAGADPLRDDPYSPLDLGLEDLRERDRIVFDFAKHHGIPLAWTLAGGYARDISTIVNAHVGTFEACLDVYRRGM